MIGQSEASPARRIRLTAFSWGAITGSAMFAMVWLATVALPAPARDPAYDLQVVVAGGDVTRAGGRQVVVVLGAANTVTCNDACDDLWVNWKTGDNDAAVKILDAHGVCIASGQDQYVTNGETTRIVVSGQAALQIRSSLIRLRADGTAEAYPPADRPGPATQPGA